jgi:hypothetical protein
VKTKFYALFILSLASQLALGADSATSKPQNISLVNLQQSVIDFMSTRHDGKTSPIYYQGNELGEKKTVYYFEGRERWNNCNAIIEVEERLLDGQIKQFGKYSVSVTVNHKRYWSTYKGLEGYGISARTLGLSLTSDALNITQEAAYQDDKQSIRLSTKDGKLESIEILTHAWETHDGSVTLGLIAGWGLSQRFGCHDLRQKDLPEKFARKF